MTLQMHPVMLHTASEPASTSFLHTYLSNPSPLEEQATPSHYSYLDLKSLSYTTSLQPLSSTPRLLP
jgi:hypothetical protein